MKFSCEKALLTGALAVAGRTVAMKSAISALEGIYISADQELTLTGYNLETGITVKIPAQISRPAIVYSRPAYLQRSSGSCRMIS